MRGHHRITLEKKPHNIRVWSAADKEKVKDLFLLGYSDAEIAHILGRTVIAVGLQRHYMKLRKAQQPHKEFVIHDAMAEYYPTWYKKHLLQQWKEQQQTSSR
ncbi:MAG: hypothetical protein E7141_04785 [Rikenellaceae bacterium]|nr:hypothetical protein [Rikenellaceae bacterium]